MSKVHVVKTNSFGGDDGYPFDDPPRAGNQKIEAIREITIRANKRVDYLSTKYLLSSGETMDCSHGKNSSGASVISLTEGERIVAVKGRSGARVDQLEFITLDNKGASRKYGPYGGSGGAPFVLSAEILAFHGKSGKEVDRIGFYAVVRTSDPYGGEGQEFADPVPVPGQSIIKQVILYTAVYSKRRIVDGIKTTYVVNGKEVVHIHGKQMGSPYSIELKSGEQIDSATVYLGQIRVGLHLVTRVIGVTVNTSSSLTHRIGRSGSRQFIVNAYIQGFVGRSSKHLTAIGFHTTPKVKL